MFFSVLVVILPLPFSRSSLLGVLAAVDIRGTHPRNQLSAVYSQRLLYEVTLQHFRFPVKKSNFKGKHPISSQNQTIQETLRFPVKIKLYKLLGISILVYVHQRQNDEPKYLTTAVL